MNKELEQFPKQYNPSKPKKDNWKILAIIFGIIIIGLILNAAYAKYEANQLERDYEVFNNGTTYAIVSILTQIRQDGFIEIPLGNQSIILVEYRE